MFTVPHVSEYLELPLRTYEEAVADRLDAALARGDVEGVIQLNAWRAKHYVHTHLRA